MALTKDRGACVLNIQREGYAREKDLRSSHMEYGHRARVDLQGKLRGSVLLALGRGLFLAPKPEA